MPTKRILQFGAYGNGNLGDAHQAEALCQHLSGAGMEETFIYSSSLLTLAHYPYPADRILDAQTIEDATFINENFDALVIGGGGLMSHPHDPLTNQDWIRRIKVPIVLAGIGIRPLPDHLESMALLLIKAAFIGARDRESLKVAASFNPNAMLMPDPILSAPLLNPSPDPRTEPLAKEPIDCLWIIRHPETELDQEHFIRAAEFIRGTWHVLRHKVIHIEPLQDQPLAEQIFGVTSQVSSAADLQQFIQSARLVLTMRFHGAIYTLRCGLPPLGLSQPGKFKPLREDYGFPSVFIDDIDDLESMVWGLLDQYEKVAETKDSIFHLLNRTRCLFNSALMRMMTHIA